MREKPLIPWIIAEPSGKVVAAHCNCTSGLGECCSHVGSLLWAIEAGVRIRDSMTVTQRKAYWVLPSTVREVPYAPMRSINFQGKSGSLSALFPKPSEHSTTTQYSSSASISPAVMVNAVSQSSIAMPHASSESSSQVEYSTSSSSPSSVSKICTRKKLCPPSSQELNGFFESLSKCSTKPAILSVVKGYSSKYIPNSLSPNLPPPLSHLFQSDCMKKTYYELL